MRIFSFLLFTCTLLFSSFLVAADFVLPESRLEIEKRDLSKYFNSEALIDIETEGGKSFAVFSQYMASQKRGVVILIPDIGHSPLSYNGFNYLYQALTDDGFDTYALQIPDIIYAEQNNTDESKEVPNKSETDAIESMDNKVNQASKTVVIGLPEAQLDDYKTQVVAIFKALYSQLTMRQQEKLVVIAQGTSAGIFGEYLAELPNIKLDAFIAISAQLPHSERQRHLPANFSLVSPPLLDVFYSNDSPLVTRNMAERIRWVKRNSKFDYRQRQLFGLTTEMRQHQRLRKEVDGFLRQL
ncbi:hypothetical protein PCIT_a1562 [Pseudoalteromonas citrea]|uniref:DUF3530 domain-containing protein n=2 Tax=Pseudoalteromonas citrea TaxID=43655 RepID=A0AAD4AMT2_9GAMM|nr:DUF3530 family protein [Pseudoalteromonas citrea]KAF7775383.1 hypothetical protein PCIT_a1562 [Pseudoalteromonas citrea]